MNIIFWMDDPNTFDISKDTSYCLIHECIKQENSVFYASKSSFSIEKSNLTCEAYQIYPFKLGQKIQFNPRTTHLTDETIDIVWIRCDPPVNQDYFLHMLMFNQYKHKILFLNDPEAILLNNEKLSSLNFQTCTPPTIITKNKALILSFLKLNKEIITKPLDGYGGMGIYKLNLKTPNLNKIIEEITNNEKKQIVVQKSVDHTKGDKRIFCLNGKALGAILRLSKSSHINNVMAGGSVYKADITENDQKIINTVKPYLIKHKLFFVGLDILDGYLTEINVTSPTCVQEFNQLNNYHLEKDIINLMNQKFADF